MKKTILLIVIVGLVLLELFAIIFAIQVFTHAPTKLETAFTLAALVAPLIALASALSVYRRLTPRNPPQ